MIGQRELTADDYLAILRRRKWILVVCTVVGSVLGFLSYRVLPKRYVSETVVLVEQPTVPEDYVKSVVNEDITQRLSTMQQQILSRSRLEPIIDKFGLYQEDRNRIPIEDLVERLQKSITVTPMQSVTDTRQLPGFSVQVTFSDPKLAQNICGDVTSMFMEQNLQDRQQLAQNTTDFLSTQVNDARNQLDSQDKKLAAFKRQYMGELPDDQQTNLSLLAGLNTQLDANTQALGRAEQDKAFAQSMLSQQIASWESSQAGHDPETLEKQLADLQNQLITLQARYTDDYPDVIKVKNDIAQLKKKISASDNSPVDAKQSDKPAIEPPQVEQLRAQIHQYDSVIKERTAEQQNIQKQISLYQSRIQLSPVVEEQYKELTRDYQTALQFYNDLLTKRSQSEMATDLERRQESEQFQVLDPPNLPDQPSFPKRPLCILGGIGGGLGLGIGIILLLEMKDTSIRAEKDIEFFLKLPTLALIPSVEAAVNGKSAGFLSKLRSRKANLSLEARDPHV